MKIVHSSNMIVIFGMTFFGLELQADSNTLIWQPGKNAKNPKTVFQIEYQANLTDFQEEKSESGDENLLVPDESKEASSKPSKKSKKIVPTKTKKSGE